MGVLMNNDGIRNYYKILNVSRTASKEEIKSAYRKLVKVTHPDVNKASDSKEKFQELLEAYEVLSNDDMRAKYDELIRSCMQKSPNAREQYQNFRQNEQREARQKAQKYYYMSLDEVLSAFAGTLLHGEKAAKVQLNAKVYHILGFRVLFCLGLISLMGTAILTIPAIILITYVIKGFFYNGTFVGIIPVVKGFLLVFAESMAVTAFILLCIGAM